MNTQAWLETLLSDQEVGDDFELPVLLSADADRVTDYVFETPGLPEMRGASAQLKWLNLDGIQRLFGKAGLPFAFIDADNTPPGCLVYAAGGGLLALVPQSKAVSLQAKIERLYPQHTGAATTTCVTVLTSPDEVRHQFGDLVKRAGHLLRTAKGQKATLPSFELLPFVRRCEACRKRPTTQFLPPYEDEPPEARCRVCAAKREEGWKRRSEWHKELGVQAPHDLEQIAKSSGEYIGVIYADGNGLGDWFQETDSIIEYRRRSRKVQDAVRAAILGAMEEYCAAHQHPFEVILVGGDDVLLIVPASDALPVAHAICAQFEEKMTADQRTMSAGVVIAEHHTPVYFLRRLASDLLKNAKRDERGSTVDFLVLKGQGTRSAEQARERIEMGPETLILNHGPYTLEELGRLLNQVSQGKKAGFPPSQLYALRAALRQGRQASALAFLYQQGKRAPDDEVHIFLNEFAAWSDQPKETPPWRESRVLRGGAKEYRTPWADLVDIWDFVE